jgi:hypothetical protein
MTIECKHGLRTGCSYCHAPQPTVIAKPGRKPATPKPATKLSDKMNDRMLALKQRLKQIRGE